MLETEFRALVNAPTNAQAMKAVVSAGFSARRDMTFIAEGVTPGEYDLVASGSDFPRTGPVLRFFATRRVNVPAVADDSETVDLGTLELKLQPPRPIPGGRKP